MSTPFVMASELTEVCHRAIFGKVLRSNSASECYVCFIGNSPLRKHIIAEITPVGAES
jgi:hypothetical protein